MTPLFENIKRTSRAHLDTAGSMTLASSRCLDSNVLSRRVAHADRQGADLNNFGVFPDIHRVFCDFNIAKKTKSHDFMSSDHIAIERMWLALHATKVEVVCRYRLVLFFHGTRSQTGVILGD